MRPRRLNRRCRVQLTGLGGVTQVAAGTNHSLAVRRMGRRGCVTRTRGHHDVWHRPEVPRCVQQLQQAPSTGDKPLQAGVMPRSGPAALLPQRNDIGQRFGRDREQG
jgi:hypothetical protein